MQRGDGGQHTSLRGLFPELPEFLAAYNPVTVLIYTIKHLQQHNARVRARGRLGRAPPHKSKLLIVNLPIASLVGVGGPARQIHQLYARLCPDLQPSLVLAL